MAGYTSKTDAALVKAFILQSRDAYLTKYEYEGTGVLDETVPGAETLTPAAAPGWTIDEFNSTVAKNLWLLDNDGDVCSCKIDDNSATVITFDKATLLKLDDGVTPAVLTDTNTYQVQIFTANNVSANGNFMGYTGDCSFEESEETIVFKYGVPRRPIREDLLETSAKLSANLISTEATLIQAIKNLVVFGDQTTEYQYAKGFVPAARDFWQVSLIGNDVNGKEVRLILIKGQFKLSGGEALSGEEYKRVPFEFNLVANNIMPDDADMYLLTQEK